MDFFITGRLLVLYAHLLLCVFALHSVLTTDWRLLRSGIGTQELDQAHRLLVWLLAGLWLSGVSIIAIDTGLDPAVIVQRPKLLTKLICVTLLTLNGALVRHWCFPRLAAGRALNRGEARALMVCGALSSSSWLMSAFLGIARPLQSWRLAECLSLYCAALGAAIVVALFLADRVLLQRPLPGGSTLVNGAGRERSTGLSRDAGPRTQGH